MKKPEIFGNSGLFIAQSGENGENSHCSVGNPNPRIRDQKAAGSNPATSTQKPGMPLGAFRVFACRWLGFGFFPGCNSSGCSRAAMHCLAASKTRLPGISVYFRFFPWRKCPIYTSKATVPDHSDSRQSARYKFRCRSRTLGW